MAKKRVWVWVVVCFLTLISLVAVPTALAQFAESTGTLQGTVKDPSGAVVPGAQVTLTGQGVVSGKTATTDKSGFYRFAELLPGTYTLTVTARGFGKYVESGILLEVGRRLTFDIELKVGDVTQVVEVTAGAAHIDTTSSKAMVSIKFETFDAAPKPRGVLDLLSWAPGARFEPAQGGFQMDGASSSENTYAIEGQDTTSILDGLAGVNPPTDFFKEVTVKSSGYEAEHGGAMGGVVQMTVKSGGDAWHGTAMLYFRHSGMNAGPRHILRRKPGVSLSTLLPRRSEPVEAYIQKKDRSRIFEPGFELGGPVWKDRLFLYTSYIPQLQRNTRTVNITSPAAPGPRAFTLTDNTHFAVGRLDGKITQGLRAYALWDYAYRRDEGFDRPRADDVNGLVNASAKTDPGTRRPDRGHVFPNVLYRFSADWTPTPKFVASGSYGKWYNGTQDRGVFTGLRYFFDASSVGALGLNGAPVRPQFQNPDGFSNIPDNFQTQFDNFARKQANADASYVFRALGTHTIKGGYSLNRLAESLTEANNFALVDIFWDQGIAQTAPFQANCAPIVAANMARFNPTNSPTGLQPADACRGNFGYWRITDFRRQGTVSSDNHGLFIQDSWNIGFGVTINGGVRFDKEFLPAFNGAVATVPIISKPIDFPFSQKIGPRVGAAWDVLRNGKVKVYGSWGWFYDIMKYSLPRGSFGGDYWHNCAFTLDTDAYTSIQPVPKPNGFACNNGAAGTLPGTFLGEEDLRIPSNTKDNITAVLDLNVKPVRQSEYVLGGEWAFTPNMSFEVRWARKRLRNTIEDMGYFTPAGEQFLIGNPGERVGRTILRDHECVVPGPTPPRDPRCDSVLGINKLPDMPKAVREYDGVEFRINKRFTANWYLNASYTWSRLFGNYTGLSSTDEDSAQRGGRIGLSSEARHDPNNSRDFDEQELMFNATGKPEFGRLPTDRPHTFKAFGGYRIKWWGMATTIAANQQWYSGTPRGTRVQFVDVDINPYVFGRSTFANITQAANGNWILNGLQKDARAPMFTNTDLSITHEFKLSKTNEALRLGLNVTILNLFNQASKITFKDRTERSRFTEVILFPDPTCADPQGCASNSGLFRKKFFDGIDPIAEANNAGTRLDSLYGLEARLQNPRALRLMLKVSF